MLTTIPEEEFLQLCEGVSEANASKRNFSWATMLKWADTRDRINQYMATTNTKYIGSGSSRTAYYLPQGKYGQNKLETPACFKVANNVKGVAQNKLEIKNLKKFGGADWPCFPYLYDWDSKKKLFMLCEVGTTLEKSEKISAKYFAQWVDFSKSYYEKNANKKLKAELKSWLKDFHSEKVLSPEDMFDAIGYFSNVVETLTAMKKKKRNKTDKETYEFFIGFLDSLAEAHPKYNGIVSAYKFCADHPKEIMASDFEAVDNWAFVKRGKEYVAIPIDWGFNREVWKKYYRNDW